MRSPTGTARSVLENFEKIWGSLKKVEKELIRKEGGTPDFCGQQGEPEQRKGKYFQVKTRLQQRQDQWMNSKPENGGLSKKRRHFRPRRKEKDYGEAKR